jgi:uncharacterized protein YecE (DUF72 family)
MDVWIGTSGYSYPDWVGGFYPADVRPNGLLAFYARQFPLVELNFSFYRPPTAAMLARQAEQTPPGFQFVVKVPRTVSHEQRRDDLPGFRLAVEELRRRRKLLGVLAQLPQAAHNDAHNRARVATMADELAGLGLAVEFRHRSWADADVPPWLAELDVDLVSVDVPNLPGLFPSGLVSSGPNLYVRLHSRDSAKWYSSGGERYDYDYSDAEIGRWVSALGRSDGGRALLLYNNCQHGHAATNARRTRDLCERAPHLHVVEPFGAPRPVQRTLFE